MEVLGAQRKELVMGVIVIGIVIVIAYAMSWRKPRTLRILGLVMMLSAIVIIPAEYYIIVVGGFPANFALTCGFWIVIWGHWTNHHPNNDRKEPCKKRGISGSITGTTTRC